MDVISQTVTGASQSVAPRALPALVCPNCKAEFQPRSFKMFFCSKRCTLINGKRAFRARQKDPSIPKAVPRGVYTSAEDALLRGVDRSAGPDGCWPWNGNRSRRGYGRVKVLGRLHTASRLALECSGGPLPDGMYALHRCDNPPCCNPAHLFAGTIADNERDKVSKGRQMRGERHHKSKLTEQDVREIRRRGADGESQNSLARAFSVTQGVVWNILKRRIWKGVA
jgi:hypothetical protein